MKYFLNISFILIFCSSFSQNKATLSLERNQLLIGEQMLVNFSIHSKKDQRAKIDFKNNNIRINRINKKDTVLLEVISKIKDTFFKEIDSYITEFSFNITAWDTGEFVIPPIQFNLDGEEVFTSPDSIYIGTVKVDTTKDIKAIKPILISDIEQKKEENQLEEKYWFWIIFGTLILTIIGLLIWYFLIRKKKNKEIIKTKLKPHEEALLALQELNIKLNNGIKNKAFYSEITLILRIYIEKRYKIRTLEKTSSQILKSLKVKRLSFQTFDDIKNILTLSDLVKFAKSTPSKEQNEENYIKAVEFINKTKPLEINNETNNNSNQIEINK